MSLLNSYVRNTAFNAAAQVILIVGNLLVTPLFLVYLGAKDYGIWVVILALSGTAGGLDLGMSVSLMRAVPEHLARRDHERLSGLAGAAVAFYMGLSAFMIGLALLGGPLLLRVPAVRVALGGETSGRQALTAAALLFLGASLAGVGRALLQGLNRFDLVAALSVATFVAFVPMALFFLVRGMGVQGLVLATLVMFGLQAAGSLGLARRLFPPLFAGLRLVFSRSVWSYLLGFGARLQVSYVADLLKMQVPKLLLSGFFGPAQAGFYDLGSRAAMAGWALPASLLPAIVPTASAAAASGDHGRLKRLFLDGSRGLLLLALPLGVALALFSDRLITVWLGQGYGAVAFVLRCLAVGNVFQLLTGVGTFIGRGLGMPGFEMRYQGLTLGLYIVIGGGLLSLFGFRGLPIGVMLACITGAAWFLTTFSRHLGATAKEFLDDVVRLPLFVTALAVVAGLGVDVSLRGRVGATASLAAAAGAFSLVCMAAWLRVLTAEGAPLRGLLLWIRNVRWSARR